MKIITKKFFLALAGMSAIFSSTIDPEFESLNATQAKLAATNLKKKVADLSALPLVAAHHAGLPGTDTDELIKAVANGSNDTWIAFAKMKITTLISTWITTLPKDGQNLLVNGVVGGVANKRRQARLIADLERVIGAADYTAVPTPADASFCNLKQTKAATIRVIINAVNTEIDRLLPGANHLDFLAGNLAAALPGFPLDRTKGAFKAVIEAKIKAF